MASLQSDAKEPLNSRAPARQPRLNSIDFLRGLAMVVMALDHARDFFNADSLVFDPTDMTKTFPFLFFTRWITHFCAPVFVFLAGTGTFLSLSRGKSKSELSFFLLTRGLWLVFLEVTVIVASWFGNFSFHDVFLQVIWAIGISMIVLAGLIHLPNRLIAVIGIGMITLHNLCDGITAQTFGSLGWVWVFLHVGGPLPNPIFPNLLIIYPLVPWIGVMALGFCFGAIMTMEEQKRKKILMRLGFGLTALFIILRVTNVYGDPDPWMPQKNIAFTVMSFLNTHKYPPSLLYLLMTLGPAILLLTFLEKVSGKISRFFITFGRVPMFYYILHVPLIHFTAIIVAYFSLHQIGFMFQPFWMWPPTWGFSLWVVYAVWLGVVLVLYPVCRRFAEFKGRNRNAWLSYL